MEKKATGDGEEEKASSRVLRRNLVAEGDKEPVYKHAAHHIVAGNSKKAEDARAILKKYGIGINDAVNGVFLPTEKGVSNAAYHPSLHTNEYYDKVYDNLREARSREEVEFILKDIKQQLLEGTF